MKSTVTRIPTDLRDDVNELREAYRNNPSAYSSPPNEPMGEVKKPNGGRNYKNTFETYTARIPDQLKPWVDKKINDFYRAHPMPEATMSTIKVPAHLKPLVTELLQQGVTTLKPVTQGPVIIQHGVTTLKPVTEEPVTPAPTDVLFVRIKASSILEYRNESKTLQQWCELLRMRFNDVRTKLNNGASVDEAFAQEENKRV